MRCSLPMLRLVILTMVSAALTLSAVAARAQTNPPYFMVASPETVTNVAGKVEVVEVFSYGCVHCAQFQGPLDSWRARLDRKKVEFVYLPAPYNSVYEMLARGFYAAASLGMTDKTHQSLFEAIHVHGTRIVSYDDIVRIYAGLGVEPDKFVKASRDFFVDAQVRRAMQLVTKHQVDSTPTLIVAGKYRITADSAGSHEEMLKVADRLIAQEIATSRQAPKSGK